MPEPAAGAPSRTAGLAVPADAPRYRDTAGEQPANAPTRGLAAVLGVAGLAVPAWRSGRGVRGVAFGATVAGARGRPLQMASLTGYGLSPVTPYGASAAYHAVRAPRLKARLGTVDHAAIVLPIAGTGTPFLLIGLCAVLWPPTVLGVACKLRGGLAYTL